MNNFDKKSKEIKRKLAKERLNRIDILFAAFGPFVSALFCIAQYFFNETILFKIIAVSLYFLILLTTYFLAISNNQKKYNKFWKHIKKYATAAGLLNPFVLAVGILLAIVRNICVLIMCAMFIIAQIVMYIIAGSDQNVKAE